MFFTSYTHIQECYSQFKASGNNFNGARIFLEKKNSNESNKENKIKRLEKRYTLGGLNFDAVIIADFDEHLVEKGFADFGKVSFADKVFQLDKTEPSLEFSQDYYTEAKAFMRQVDIIREEQITRLADEETVS